MAYSKRTASVNGKQSSSSNSRKLDRFSEEFALLVRKHVPSFGKKPADWLARLPSEVFFYYSRGNASFGRPIQSEIEERGRLYLLHTALVLLWMRWGKKGARRRLRGDTQKGVRRTARLTCLERYRRAKVLAEYNSGEWFNISPERWTVAIRSSSVDLGRVASGSLRESLQAGGLIEVTTDELAMLSRERAIPRQADLPPVQ